MSAAQSGPENAKATPADGTGDAARGRAPAKRTTKAPAAKAPARTAKTSARTTKAPARTTKNQERTWTPAATPIPGKRAARSSTPETPTPTRPPAAYPPDAGTATQPGNASPASGQRARRTVTHSGTARERISSGTGETPTSSAGAAAAAAALGGRADALAAGHSVVGALLADHVGEIQATPQPRPFEAAPARPGAAMPNRPVEPAQVEPAQRARAHGEPAQVEPATSGPTPTQDRTQDPVQLGADSRPEPDHRPRRRVTARPAPTPPPVPTPPTTLVARPALPPMEDVTLGVLVAVAERSWRIGARAVALAAHVSMRVVDAIRALSPQIANEKADARLAALAQRGRAVRAERTAAVSAAFSEAIIQAAASDAMRQMTVTAMEEAAEEVLAVVLPTMLDAVTDLETQERLDELMAGLLLRQLPSALEKTLPGVMMRAATRPAAGLLPFLGGVLPR